MMLMLTTGPVLANSVTYKISVTIPAIVGVNVPPFEEPYKQLRETQNGQLDTIIEEAVRNNRMVTLKTIVEK